ncbi:MAG: carboxypeptidase regulatory-like domain-containing protein [Phaeodactylibacter xiamenensis]|uniref:Dockerin domain-containing protein n=1 Tax=Phaeodactylibacter xiamenensis TaxID=1524460 RepID=A0A098SAT6_9BACT|nr:carboxypeptidase regulatory-like domain-containing protein [Phaeodactylibacter xiamenensis]KGE89659.1 hypothetical protein IX84_01080 [Phaeodactylibacter xiamenensis]MCR9053831.1 carboxypeptidase regulatory-like domain-containing protein [bacterium]
MKNVITLVVLCLCSATVYAQTATISGQITRLNDSPVSGILVHLLNWNEGLIAADTTDTQGAYAFSDLTTGQEYTVVPQDNQEVSYLQGVSTLDVVIAARIILGIQPPETPFVYAAGDVNNSGSLTTLDLVLMRRLILGIDNSFQNSPSVRYLRTNASFINPDSPFSGINYGNSTLLLDTDTPAFDFYQIKMGNLNP